MKGDVRHAVAQKTVVIPGADGLFVLQLNADGTAPQNSWYTLDHPSTQEGCYGMRSATAHARLLGQFWAIVCSNVPLNYAEVREYVDGYRASTR